MIKIRRGLDLPLSGAPQQSIEDAAVVSQVAVIGADYVGMKPTMAVREGDRVKLGQVLFSDKKTTGVHFTAPAAGMVNSINRGAQRVLQSVVIDIDGDDAIEFATCAASDLASLTAEQVAENLQASGLWAALRTRPFSKVPAIDSRPRSIFVTAIDTHPLAANPAPIIAAQQDAFAQGLELLTKLTDGQVFICSAAETQVPQVTGTQVERFEGVHPAGLASTHIHMLDPVSATKTVWTVGYQDVIAFGQLFATGKLPTERIVALSGPMVIKPRLVRTRLGASTTQSLDGETAQGEFENRVISGSVLGGSTAFGAMAFLGRYNNQITVLQEGKKREFMGWLSTGSKKHSMQNIFLSSMNRSREVALNTSTNGSQRSMVPIGAFERLMPLDILPTQLLRSLVVGDIVNAQELGCLELEEADLALMTYACAGKYEYGAILRNVLTRIEKEC